VNGAALYHGSIRHRRFTPVTHAFRYRLTMPLLDLDNVEQMLRLPLLFGTRYPGLGWFRRRDYFGDPAIPLKTCVLNEVEEQTGWRPDGPVLLLSHLRYWGFIMNPISVFYCHDRSGGLRALLLQVTNTPWREKTCYVLEADPGRRNQSADFHKAMHVSPFNPMDMSYLCRFREPGEQLVFHLENHHHGRRVTDATLVMKRSPMTFPRLAALVLRQPAMTLKTGIGIYWQALKLWRKGAPVHDHPQSGSAARSTEELSPRGPENPLT
jgi:DUF1365 family protein